jgi:hypothetical protein
MASAEICKVGLTPAAGVRDIFMGDVPPDTLQRLAERNIALVHRERQRIETLSSRLETPVSEKLNSNAKSALERLCSAIERDCRRVHIAPPILLSLSLPLLPWKPGPTPASK